MEGLALGPAACRWRSPRGGRVLLGWVPLYTGLSGSVGAREGIRRRRSVRRWGVGWRRRGLPEVLHWSELFVFMVATVIGVLVMLARTRSVEG